MLAPWWWTQVEDFWKWRLGLDGAVGEAEQQLVNVQTCPKQDRTANFLQFFAKLYFKVFYFTLKIFWKCFPQMTFSIALGGVGVRCQGFLIYLEICVHQKCCGSPKTWFIFWSLTNSAKSTIVAFIKAIKVSPIYMFLKLKKDLIWITPSKKYSLLNLDTSRTEKICQLFQSWRTKKCVLLLFFWADPSQWNCAISQSMIIANIMHVYMSCHSRHFDTNTSPARSFKIHEEAKDTWKYEHCLDTQMKKISMERTKWRLVDLRQSKNS